MNRGCFIGRFQPFHDGHRAAVEGVVADVDELVLGIGSAGASHSVHDPFTGGERIEMVAHALDDLDVRTYPIPIEDVERHAIWARHVETLCPSFDVVYSNNPLVTRLFEETGHEVRGFEMHDRGELEGTKIRRRMIDGEEWRHLVPDAVVTVIEDVDGVERIRRVAETDASDG